MDKEKAPIDQCCDKCERDTRFGTGLFVNRVPSDVGFICPECLEEIEEGWENA